MPFAFGQVYKPDQASKSRWIFALSAVSLVLFGCYQLFYTLPESMRGHAFGGFRPLGEEFPVSWAFLLSIGLSIAGLAGVWWAINFPRLIDFFAETEVEMTKVSWSSRREVVGSSIVVIATVVILAIWIGTVDVVLALPWGEWVSKTFGRLFS